MGLITWVAIGVLVLVGIGLGWGVFFSGLTQGVEKVAENPAVQEATDEAAEFIDESIDTETSSIDRIVVVNTEKTVYTQQEPVVIIVKNEGNQTMQVSDSSIDVQIRNADDTSQEGNDVVVVSQVITELDPGESVTITWDQKDSNGNHVKSGKYVAIVNNVPSEEESSRTTFTIEA
jgi:archaellum component FlaG (FlaF/FlaG flagellin family)